MPCYMWEDYVSYLYIMACYTRSDVYSVTHRPAYICILALWTKYKRLHTTQVPVSYKSEAKRLMSCKFSASSWLQLHQTLLGYLRHEICIQILFTKVHLIQYSLDHPNYMRESVVRNTRGSGTPRKYSVLQVNYKKSQFNAKINSLKRKYRT